MAQISISDKTEETELLKEYIIMEKEKLNDGQKAFKEDQDKYEKYKMELQNKSDETEKQVREVVEKGLQLQLEMMNLTKELGVLSNA